MKQLSHGMFPRFFGGKLPQFCQTFFMILNAQLRLVISATEADSRVTLQTSSRPGLATWASWATQASTGRLCQGI